jgi:hypothetical protein
LELGNRTVIGYYLGMTNTYHLIAENTDGTTTILSEHAGRAAADKAWTKARKAGHAKYLPLPAGVRRIVVEKAAR